MKHFLNSNCIIAFIVILTLVSCGKAPVAGFNTDKTEYINGEVIKLTNTSVNGSSYKWTGSGINGELTSQDAQIITSGAGIYNVTLTVFNKSSKRFNKISKGIKVANPGGVVSFYTLNASILPITVYVDTNPIGTINQAGNSVPACGASGCLTTNIDAGQHQYLFICGGIYKYANDTVIVNTCKTFAVL
jgi:PKD repeat protein